MMTILPVISCDTDKFTAAVKVKLRNTEAAAASDRLKPFTVHDDVDAGTQRVRGGFSDVTAAVEFTCVFNA